MYSSLRGQYSWNQRGLAGPFARATASSEREAAPERMSGTPRAPAARAVASSASGWKQVWQPTGAMMSGEGYLVPKRVVCGDRRRGQHSKRWDSLRLLKW